MKLEFLESRQLLNTDGLHVGKDIEQDDGQCNVGEETNEASSEENTFVLTIRFGHDDNESEEERNLREQRLASDRKSTNFIIWQDSAFAGLLGYICTAVYVNAKQHSAPNTPALTISSLAGPLVSLEILYTFESFKIFDAIEYNNRLNSVDIETRLMVLVKMCSPMITGTMLYVAGKIMSDPLAFDPA